MGNKVPERLVRLLWGYKLCAPNQNEVILEIYHSKDWSHFQGENELQKSKMQETPAGGMGFLRPLWGYPILWNFNRQPEAMGLDVAHF